MSLGGARLARAIEVLSESVSPPRLQRLRGAVHARLADTTLVLESLADSGNAAAILRTAEALGLQHVHVITAHSPFVPLERGDSGTNSARASRGTLRWLTLHVHPNVAACVSALKAERFTLWGTDLGPGSVPLDAAVGGGVPTEGGFRPRVALAFGNEKRGCSRALLSHCDARVAIPMAGLVQSLNVSAAAAIGLHTLVRRGGGAVERLSAESADHLLFSWLVGESIHTAAKLERAGLRPDDF